MALPSFGRLCLVLFIHCTYAVTVSDDNTRYWSAVNKTSRTDYINGETQLSMKQLMKQACVFKRFLRNGKSGAESSTQQSFKNINRHKKLITQMRS